MTELHVSASSLPEMGTCVEVETDYSSYKSGFAVSVSRRGSPKVGIVTDVDEDGTGFEMTTGEGAPFLLREVLMKWVVAVRPASPASLSHHHRAGVAEANERAKLAEKRK